MLLTMCSPQYCQGRQASAGVAGLWSRVTPFFVLLLTTTRPSCADHPYQPSIVDNLRLVYEPWKKISLWTPLVGQRAKWTVHFHWLRANRNCSKRSDTECDHLNVEGRCNPCIIKLNEYLGYGQYKGQGNVFNRVQFTLRLGNVTDSKSFYLPDWIKPGPVSNLQMEQNGPYWLLLNMSLPSGLDQSHLRHISGNNALSLVATVELISFEEQSLNENDSRLFYKTYGFVRNLRDDEEALSVNVSSAFPRSYKRHVWKSEELSEEYNITRLPLAGYRYKITLQTHAHYPGESVSFVASTSESAPQEGPQLHANFAYCPLTREQCTSCTIYFKEIPRPRRGGIVVNYTLTMHLLNGDKLTPGSYCGSNTVVQASTGGQNNSFHVASLPVGAEYNISLLGFTSKGPSPVTTAVLHVQPSPPPFSAEDVVVEFSGTTYRLSWRSAEATGIGRVRYTVHTCQALPLHVHHRHNTGTAASRPPARPLNCVTNMASLEVPENSTNSHTFVNVHHGRGLTPAFFISTITSTNLTSGLQPVHCFYAKNVVPAKVASVELRQPENTAVEVIFQLPCGKDLSYRHGRPDSYVIGIAKRHTDMTCHEAMAHADLYPRFIHQRLLQPVLFRRKDLQENTAYCVCVQLLARNESDKRFKRGRWTCRDLTTASTTLSVRSVRTPVIFVVAVIVFGTATVYIIVMCRRRYQKNLSKFNWRDGRRNSSKAAEEITRMV